MKIFDIIAEDIAPRDGKWVDPNIGKILQENYNCTMFLHGHSHMLKQGPLNYECGSDYDKPSYKIWEA